MLKILDKLLKKFWTIPILAIVIYSATILLQYGYNNYFNIPEWAVNPSLVSNVLFIFFAVKILFSVVTVIPWWMWILLFLFFIILFLFFKLDKFYKTIPVVAIILFLYKAPDLGGFIAKNQGYFYTLDSACKIIDPSKYIIPCFYNDKAVLVSVDDGTKKMTGGFLIKNISELGCEMKLKKIGQIKQ